MAPHPTAFLTRALRVARTEIGAVVALLVLALGVLTFIELADDMREADGQAFDQAVLHAVRPFTDDPGRPWGPWWLHEAAADITSLGGISVLALFALIALGFLVIQRKRLSALLLVIGLGGGVALSEGLKAVFERERPPQVYQAVETLNASFPSGHALLSTVFYLTLGVMLTRAFPRRRLKAYVLAVSVVIALLIGLTRIYLGAHWASDVFAGWSVGAAWAMVLWLAAYALERRQRVRGAALHDEPSA
ncbi:MAG: phosphatase PAP2 family protein [Brevundimonas sp.]|uniref:phosphatase PAP2 family protein n=1 Tax=Brevundimonas sp. TaxID=1871086 RepID=UPI0011F58FCF|nr:phosphatase PAP2 family protein [Brevundimonas sp.]RZJ19083.1 MAG: phosphatase PAP2 family protein [Brevundimonas sp.]